MFAIKIVLKLLNMRNHKVVESGDCCYSNSNTFLNGFRNYCAHRNNRKEVCSFHFIAEKNETMEVNATTQYRSHHQEQQHQNQDQQT